MKSPRKIIVEIAASADGYIARPNGDIEWLNRRARLDYGMMKFYRTIDTILWGRKTYDWAMAYQKKSGSQQSIFDKNVANYVFSHKLPRKHPPEVQFISEPVKKFARRLRTQPGKNIWMMGGGELIASFLDAGEIDEFQIKVVPVFIGKGIPLIAPRHRDIPLHLLSSRKFPDGVVQLHYAVEKNRRNTTDQ